MERKSLVKRIRLIPVILLVLYLMAAVSAFDAPVRCTCDCDGTIIEATGNTGAQCSYSCGAICGGYTRLASGDECHDDCKTDYCGDSDVMDCTITPVGSTCMSGCESTCNKSCKTNTSIYDIISTVQYILFAIAAAIFAICGLKLIISEDSESRDSAKKCIIPVIMVFLLIGIAKPLVYTFYAAVGIGGMGSISGTTIPIIPVTTLPTKGELVGEIGEAIVMAWDATCEYKEYDYNECEGFGGSQGKETLYGKVDVSEISGYEITEEDINDYLISRQPPVRCIDDLLGTVSAWRDAWWKFMIFSSITSDNEEVCIIYRRIGNRIAVYQSSDNGICADFSNEVKQLGDAIASCWDNNEEEEQDNLWEQDKFCGLIEVSGWSTVKQDDVKDYLFSIGREKGGPGSTPGLDFPMDWEAGDIPEDMDGDRVCIWFDAGTGLIDSKEVFVSKESEEWLCMQGAVQCEFPQVLEVEVLEA